MLELRQKFEESHPSVFFLSFDKTSLSHYLLDHHFLKEGETVSDLEKAGEGNMNFVLRVITNQRSFIVKQARPWVEKYPQIAAPVDRNKAETAYYKVLKMNDLLESFSPLLLLSDEDSYLAVYSDLGDSRDLSYLYERKESLKKAQLNKLLAYLSELHSLDVSYYPENRTMRELNHEHIFRFPFLIDNGFDLNEVQEGLQELALSYKTNSKLKERIKHLGKIYLDKGEHLLHGDFYPGSWLANNTGIKIIDPEFSFLGPAEFDVGVLLAHLYMANQGEILFNQVLANYQKPTKFDMKLVAGFAGTEIMRRLIGVAQLPLSYSINEKGKMLEKASKWVLNEAF